MLEHDYLMRMILELGKAIRNVLVHRDDDGLKDHELDIMHLEDAIGSAADIDASVLLALDPTSVATMLSLGSINDSVAEYIVQALLLEADLLEESGFSSKAQLRREQADAVAREFYIECDPERVFDLINQLPSEE